ncbi:hypothetical protein VE03_08003 [Pseudogymnoascus sp. 23342-1-I1]|nr:hypothetical protein VE03_08003 [Pseudogymnoascus sp. 23342-1-I1]
MLFSELPPEVLLSIADHLETVKVIFSLLRTCTRNYQILLSFLYNHNVKYSSGSALIWCVDHGNEAGARLLLELGANPMSREQIFYSESHFPKTWPVGPLHFAQTETMAKLLLDFGAEVEDSPRQWGTPLHAAATKANLPLAKFLLEYGKANANHSNNWGATPLHVATEQGNLDLATLLLNHGADVNFYDLPRSMHPMSYYGTPLHSTLRRNDDSSFHMVDLFVKHGVDLEKKDVFSDTALHVAVKQCRKPIIKLLIDHGSLVNAQNGDGQTPLHQAATRPEKGVAIAKLLLYHGALVNIQDNDNVTPLYAAAWGYTDMVKLLLSHGAQVNLSNNGGVTPLSLAGKRKELDIAKLLLAHGALVDVQNRFDSTPLLEAAAHGWVPIAQLLLTHGAQVNLPNNRGETPLHEAIRRGRLDMAEFLLGHGALVNMRDGLGRNSLHCVAGQLGKRTSEQFFELLLEHGALINAQDNDEVTPLHIALRLGGLNVVKLFIKHRPDIDIKDLRGRSVCDYAKLNEGCDTATWLLAYDAKRHGELQ